jgi:rSAM/selenodomain-associated transferase 1
MPPLVILFAKAPVPGQVKTRLRLDSGAAAALHEAMVRDVFAMLATLPAELELHTDIRTDAWPRITVARKVQVDGDLGQKMLAALGGGDRQVMIVGSDAPTLPRGHLENLLASTADVALGPTEDGGYYAIACRRTHPKMFDGVEWSTKRAMEQTVAATRACGLSVEIGPPWFDVDSPADLERLYAGGWQMRESRK